MEADRKKQPLQVQQLLQQNRVEKRQQQQQNLEKQQQQRKHEEQQQVQREHHDDMNSCGSSSPPASSTASLHPQRCARCCCCCCCSCSSSSSSKYMQRLPAEALCSRVVLNVGGKKYLTTVSTLCNYAPHYFSCRLSPPWRDGETREIFIDRNGEVFSYVLDFLRNGALCCSNKPWLLQQLLLEANFFCVRQLQEEIERRLAGLKTQGIASRCQEADRVGGGVARGVSRSGDAAPALELLSASVLQQQQQQHSMVPQQQQLLPVLQQLQHAHINSNPSASSPAGLSESHSLLHGRRSSSSSNGSSGSRSSSSMRRGSNGSDSSRDPVAAATAAGIPGVETPQERAKLARIAAAAELAARAESLRRSLVNDDPEPPEPHAVKDLGARVLLTDEDF